MIFQRCLDFYSNSLLILYIGDISVWSLEKKERKKLETNLVEAWLENHQFSAVGANNLPIVHNNGIK